MPKVLIPDWARQYQTSNTTIKPNGKGFSLYTCTSVYDNGKSRSIQTYCAKIDKEKGLIPKKELHLVMTGVNPQEYGLSYVTMLNLKNDLQNSLFNGGDGEKRGILVRLAVIQFTFGDISSFHIKASVISRGKEEALINRAQTVNPKQISRLSQTIRNFYRQRIPDDDKRTAFPETLKMITIPEDMLAPTNPVFPEQIVTISQEHKIRLYKGEHLA
jgi:hypothetical protein